MKKVIRKILKEETTNRFIEKVASYLKPPYFHNMEILGVSEDEYEMVLSKVYNEPVTIKDNTEYSEMKVYNQYGDNIYNEDSGDWDKRVSLSHWDKREYDTNGRIVYYEDSNGSWMKREYDSNGNEIYYEDSNGSWSKREYDSNGNEIYYEDSNGYWIKKEYDFNGDEIYIETSDGYIEDYR